ncbi:MAG: hypothetical protein GY834_12640 [Bacteroidetes bacterium]|nr:hypothetical protein [Bacteroidota bacterium]
MKRGKMDLSYQRMKRIGFLISENVWYEFKQYVSRENTTIPKLLGQFMVNYVDYLDVSFIDTNKESTRNEKTKISFTLSSDICKDFRNKIKSEKVSMSMIVEQFMKNYVIFLKKNSKTAIENEY